MWENWSILDLSSKYNPFQSNPKAEVFKRLLWHLRYAHNSTESKETVSAPNSVKSRNIAPWMFSHMNSPYWGQNNPKDEQGGNHTK